MLVLAPRLADHEGHRLRPLHQLEVGGEQVLQPVERGVGLAVLLEAADPFLALGVLFQPGVGRGEQQQAAGVQAPRDVGEEAARAVQAVDQVGGEDEVEAGEDVLEVAGVALPELDAAGGLGEAERVEPALVVAHQLALVGHGVAQRAGLGELGAGLDEARREVDADHALEGARQLEARPPGGAAQIERAAEAAVAEATLGADRDVGERLREVGHAEGLVAVVELGVLRQQRVGLVGRGRVEHRRLADDVAESRVLEEVAAEGVARGVARLVAGGDPASALDDGVAVIEGWRGEVVVDRMHLEAVEGIGRRLAPLPDVADHVEEIAMREARHRAARGPVVEVQVGLGRCVVRHVGEAHVVVDAVPLVLGRQAHRLPGLARLPATEGACLQAIDLGGPVPAHRHFLGQQAQFPAAGIRHPEGGMFGAGEALPAQALLVPHAVVGVAAGLDEAEVFAVRHQITRRLESRHLGAVRAVFVVPAVDRLVEAAAQLHGAGGDVDQRVGRRLAVLGTGLPGGMRLDVLQRVLAHQHRRGLEVDTLVLDAHHHRPERILPADRQREGRLADHAVDHRAHLVAVGGDLGHGGPVVARVVEVVPAHLVHADREHRFQARIDALLDQAGEQELVDEEGGGVAEVEDQRVTQADRLPEVSLVAGEHLEQRLVAIEGGVEVVQQLGALGLDVGAGQERRAREARRQGARRGLRRSGRGGLTPRGGGGRLGHACLLCLSAKRPGA